MKLLVIAIALFTVCYADKLDRGYLPPVGAHAAGGSPGAIQAPGSGSSNYQGHTPFGGPSPVSPHPASHGSISGPSNPGPASNSEHSNDGFIPTGTQFNNGSPSTSYEAHNGAPAFGPSGPADSTGPAQSYGSVPSGHNTAERPQAAFERNSGIIRQHNDLTDKGFSYAFETDNGISAEESGTATNGVQARGGYSYTGDDGNVYSITYTADENGYRPQGDHLPTPPPIPEAILKSLEIIAQAKASGTSQDGFYNTQHHGAENTRPGKLYDTPHAHPSQGIDFNRNDQYTRNNNVAQSTQHQNASPKPGFGVGTRQNEPQYNGFSQQSSLTTQTSRPNQYVAPVIQNNSPMQHDYSSVQHSDSPIQSAVTTHPNLPGHNNDAPAQQYNSPQYGAPNQHQSSAPVIQHNAPAGQTYTPQNNAFVQEQQQLPVPVQTANAPHQNLPSHTFNAPAQQYNSLTSPYGSPNQHQASVPANQHNVPVQTLQSNHNTKVPGQQYLPQHIQSSTALDQNLPAHNAPTQQYHSPTPQSSSFIQHQTSASSPQYNIPARIHSPQQNDSPNSVVQLQQHNGINQQSTAPASQYGAPVQNTFNAGSQYETPIQHNEPKSQDVTQHLLHVASAKKSDGSPQHNVPISQNYAPANSRQNISPIPQHEVPAHQFNTPAQYSAQSNHHQEPKVKFVSSEQQHNTPQKDYPATEYGVSSVENQNILSQQHTVPAPELNAPSHQNTSPAQQYGTPEQQTMPAQGHSSAPDLNTSHQHNYGSVHQYSGQLEGSLAPQYGVPAQKSPVSGNFAKSSSVESAPTSFGSSRAPPTFDSKTGYKY